MCCSTENADKEFTGEIYHTTGETSPGDICLCKEHLVTHVHTFCMVSDITAVTGDAIVFSSDCFGASTTGKPEVAWQGFDLNIKTSLYDWANSLYTTETQMKQDPQKKKKVLFGGRNDPHLGSHSDVVAARTRAETKNTVRLKDSFNTIAG